MGHSSWDCSSLNSLNFGVLMEPEVSELPKGLVLGRDENIYIRLTGSIPLGDVGSCNNCHIPARAPTTSQAQLHRSMILSALGPDHTLTVLFLGTYASKTSQWVTLPGNALAHSCLTSEFLRNPRPVSSQKASC